MKRNILIGGALVLFALALLFGCTMPGVGTFTLGENFTAKEGNFYYNSAEELGVYLVGITDSRCPQEVKCVWAEEFGADLFVVAKDFNQVINLGETTNPEVLVGSKYIITLVSVDPDTNGAVLRIDSVSGDFNNLLVGGDKDEHGCIGSAGYSWCEAKQKCLRVWEEPCNGTDDNVNVGLANPASTKCINNGGTLKIVDTNEGQVGMCTLLSGKVCEEWALFRGECGDTS